MFGENDTLEIDFNSVKFFNFMFKLKFNTIVTFCIQWHDQWLYNDQFLTKIWKKSFENDKGELFGR